MKKILGILFLVSAGLVSAEGRPDYEKKAQEALEKADFKAIAQLIAAKSIAEQPWVHKVDALKSDACQVVEAKGELFKVKDQAICKSIMNFGRTLWWAKHDIMVAQEDSCHHYSNDEAIHAYGQNADGDYPDQGM